MGKAGSLDYKVERRDYIHDTQGLTRGTADTLIKKGYMAPDGPAADSAREPVAAPSSARPDPERDLLPPSDPRVTRVKVPPVTVGAVVDEAPPTRAPESVAAKIEATRAAGRKQKKGARVAPVPRLIRFPLAIEEQLQALSLARGMSLNATVCIAVTEDWRRLCR